MQHKDVDIGQPAQGRDGGRAGIARVAANGGPIPARASLARANSRPSTCSAMSLKAGGAVKQLQQIFATAQIAFKQRRDGGGIEPGIGG